MSCSTSHIKSAPSLKIDCVAIDCSDDLAARELEGLASLDPVEVLQRAFERSVAEGRKEVRQVASNSLLRRLTQFFPLQRILGTSTAALAILKGDQLRLANIGDSSCLIIRGSEIIFQSEEQQHSFNFPLQVGVLSLRHMHDSSTPAEYAESYTVTVQKGDIVILSTDGLGDNLFNEEILEEVLRFAQPCHPNVIAKALCERVQKVYGDDDIVVTPFQQKISKAEPHRKYSGGKIDDVSVVVGVVSET